MRKLFSPLPPLFMLLLACAAAHAQPARRPGRETRCGAAATRYVHPSPDKKFLTVEAEDDYEYRGMKKYLSVCGDMDDAFTQRVREEVATYEGGLTLRRLLPAVGRPDSPESKDPHAYAAIAGAYEASVTELTSWRRINTLPEVDEGYAQEIGEKTDLLVDAYARAVAACGARADCRTQKAAWTRKLTEFYKSRHGDSDAGLDEFIRGALERPLPQTLKR